MEIKYFMLGLLYSMLAPVVATYIAFLDIVPLYVTLCFMAFGLIVFSVNVCVFRFWVQNEGVYFITKDTKITTNSTSGSVL